MSGMWKDAQTFRVNLWRSAMSGTAFNCPYQVGVPNWSAWYSNHDSKSLIGGLSEGSLLSITGSWIWSMEKACSPWGSAWRQFWVCPPTQSGVWGWCRLPDWALCKSPNGALHQLHVCVLCLLPNHVICQVSLWLHARGLPLNSLSSLSKLLCRAAVVSTTFWWAIHRAAL